MDCNRSIVPIAVNFSAVIFLLSEDRNLCSQLVVGFSVVRHLKNRRVVMSFERGGLRHII
jgi:hypothetical protein